MPAGPKGEKRPADVIGNAVKVMRIATGEGTDELPDDGKDPAAKALGRKGGAAQEHDSGAPRGDCPESRSEALGQIALSPAWGGA